MQKTEAQISQPVSREPVWIGIVGAAKAGKDTLADTLRSEVPYQFLKPRLSEPIKRVGKTYYSMTDVDCSSQKGKAADHDYLTDEEGEPLTNRNVLEIIGDKLQELDPLVLLRYVEQRVNRAASEQGNLQGVILPDLRTEPQAQWIRDQGGIIVYVQRNEAEEKAESVDDHHTKTFYNRTKADVVIHNNGSLPDFRRTVRHTFFRQLSSLFPGIDKNFSL